MVLICLFLILFPTQIMFDSQNQIVFWNVGQGQWITVIDSTTCYHFDVGGEFFNSKLISQNCSQKRNKLFISHWHWDHIGFALKLKNLVRQVCIHTLPRGKIKQSRRSFLNKIVSCNGDKQKVKEIRKVKNIQKLRFNYSIAKNSHNDLSHIFIYDKKFLIPGDSTKKMEKIWGPLLQSIPIKWLAVSHHGSKTSTSKDFLKYAAHLKQAIVSARKKVYGHPHKEVLRRLKRNSIAVLKTEDWGNIRILIR